MKRIFFVLMLLFLAAATVMPADKPVTAQDDKPFKTYLPLVSKPPEPYKLDGLDFSPYMAGQSPNWGGTWISEEQIQQRLSIVGPHTKWIRTFGCGDGLEQTGKIAHKMGLKVAMGAWIGKDLTVNQTKLNCVIQQAKLGYADMVVVGSEVLLRNDVSYEQLVTYIQTVRQQIPAGIPITYGDVYGMWFTYPNLANEVDLIFANIYPFWEGFPVEQALAVTDHYYNLLVTKFPGKTVNISEAGWPSCGNYSESVGSVENEAKYFNQLISWEKAKNITLFYFSAFDEEWKAWNEGLQGQCWGLWNQDGAIKPGIQSILDGYTVPFDATLPKTCNTDTPSFEFVYMPPLGSLDDITGRACGVFKSDYNVILFISVWNSWYVRPWGGGEAYTPISSDGSWTVDYTKVDVDPSVSAIRAYLVPKGIDYNSDLSSYPMIEVNR